MVRVGTLRVDSTLLCPINIDAYPDDVSELGKHSKQEKKNGIIAAILSNRYSRLKPHRQLAGR